MGKIIINGIEYSGTYDSADSVNYDNSNSGLNARTVQEGIDVLSDGLSDMNDGLTASDNLKFRFSTDGEGNYGFLGADDCFIPFNANKCAFGLVTFSTTNSTSVSYGFKAKYLCVTFSKAENTHNYGATYYNSDIDTSKVWMYNGSAYTNAIPNTNANNINQITDDGFTFGKVSSNATYGYYFAIG